MENEKVIIKIITTLLIVIGKVAISGLIQSTRKRVTKTNNKFKIWLNTNREFGSLIWESFWLIIIVIFFCIFPLDGKVTNFSVHLIALLTAMMLLQFGLLLMAVKDYQAFRKQLKNN